VTRSVGKGRVVAVGFLPAVSYIRAALGTETKGPKDGVPAIDGVDLDAAGQKTSAPPASAFPARLRDLICRPVRAASTRQPVEADLPLIEATVLEGSAGWVVPLANYTLKPAAKVTLTIHPGDRAFGEVRSSRQGVLAVERIGDNAVRVALPLDSTDLLFAEWVPNK
jgi:hypothetical protein